MEHNVEQCSLPVAPLVELPQEVLDEILSSVSCLGNEVLDDSDLEKAFPDLDNEDLLSILLLDPMSYRRNNLEPLTQTSACVPPLPPVENRNSVKTDQPGIIADVGDNGVSVNALNQPEIITLSDSEDDGDVTEIPSETENKTVEEVVDLVSSSDEEYDAPAEKGNLKKEKPASRLSYPVPRKLKPAKPVFVAHPTRPHYSGKGAYGKNLDGIPGYREAYQRHRNRLRENQK